MRGSELREEYKMQNDSLQLSTSDHVKHVNIGAVSQESFQCGHCVLIFKTKVYLFEHLNKVHGFDVDAARKDAGLNSSEANETNTDNSCVVSGDHLKCQHCGFIACSGDVLNKHVNQCLGTPNVIQNTDSKSLANQHDEAAGADEIPSVLSNTSTSKTTHAPCSPKDLKTYRRPSKSTTKYISTSVSNEEAREMSADGTKATLILQDSPSCSNPNSSGVFKVTAKSLIDIDISADNKFYYCSQTENFFTADVKPPKLREHFKETGLDNAPKRTKKVGSHATKKAKLDSKDIKLPDKEKTSKQLAFEFSDDEEERKSVLVNGDAKSPKMYFCKHCDYRNVDIASLSSHYQDDHPYIRCNAVYIHDSNDESATFRCLECPVEFLNMIDLKRHYTKNHPKAPDVFAMKSRELSLIFKCFVCQFTTNILKSLKNHYKENHATLEVDNSLLFCRYSVNGSQEELSPLNTCGHTPTPDRSEALSPRSAPCKEAETAASPQQSTSSGEDVSLYKCSHCKFSHKSAVVMQVHYQKHHPENAITIDKIKQSAQTTPQKSPNSLLAKASTPQSTSDPSKETKDKAEPPQKKALLTLESVEDRGKTKKLHNKRKREASPSGDSAPSKTFYCKFCSYTCENRRSLIGHHYGKHPSHKHMDSQEILKYSSEVQKKKCQSDAEKRTSSTGSKTKKQEPGQTNVSLAATSVKGHKNIYLHAEKLFYCQKCNYGNPSIFGVMTHQAKTHQGINTSGKHVSAYSAVIREEIKKSKLNAKDSSFSTLLPLPLMNKGDENMFFCHFCNYRKGSVSQVMKHYNRRHQKFVAHPSQIQQYTSMVLRETEKLLKKAPRNQQVNQESLEKGENINEKMKQLSKPLLVPASSSKLTQRSLQCFRCTFSTQYVYMLKKHLREIHHVQMTVTQVLRTCFRKGMLQSGYHCELCVFSHDKAAEVYMHYKKCHQRRKSSLEFVNTRLYVGPETAFPEEKMPKQKCVDGGSPSAKEDGLEHDKKKAGGDGQVEGHDKIHQLFDSYQVPLEFDKSFDDATASPKLFKCHYCAASFNSRRGLTIHCGIKHTDIQMEKNSEEKQQQQQQQQVPVQTRVHVFKCLHCTYVNTSYHGVITHCKMKHPSLPSRADSLHVDLTCIQHCSDKRIGPDETLKLSGHMCETCSQICTTLEKLTKHCEKEHNETDTDNSVVKTFKPAAESKRQLSILKASFLNKKMCSQIKCQHCSYKCSTKIALIRHVRVHHLSIVTKDSDYRCVLCSKPYYRKQHLSTHYTMKHGSDAYLKYFVPIYGQVPKSPNWLSTQQPPNNNHNATAKETKILVYRCPSCPYMNGSYHGTLTHCQMKHPTVTARADELQTCEILSTNMVKCDLGKGSNARGYMCRKCPQIYASLKNLKIHCLNHDAPDSSETAVEIEKVQSSKESVSQASLFDNKTSEVMHSSPEICQSNSPSGQKNMLYRCQLCDYKGFYRRYLQSHYKKAHKLDVQTVSKLLQRYDKRNKARVQTGPQSEEAASVTCKRCPNLTFKSSELLIEHYSATHRILDFTVLSLGFKHKSTGAYKCVHCDMHLNGTRKLAFHLDRHRERKTLTAGAAKTTTAPSEDKSLTFSRQEDVPTLENVDELTEWSGTPAQTFSVPTSPPPSPSRGTDVKRAKPESGYACKQCRRTFMSLKGLRTHERSHATMAAIKKIDKVPISNLKEKVSKFVLYKPGTLRPFMCSFCSYRTPVMGLWWSHFMKKHGDECPELNVDQAEPDIEESTEPADKGIKYLPKVEEEPAEVQESMYLEPPDVQRQLNHYNLMAQTKSKTVVQESKFTENRLYHCELCNFCSGHLSSIRRHYLNCHGKKMLRCKDCSFVTVLRKTLEMHMASGHSTCQSKPTHDKDLRCPFCLYQTKNKNNMIDHIVLHREERVVPIEVRRPKLSRYLQGIVFRCQKCTFSSSTADNLRLHMTKHDDVNPYKCRLCYFDCTRLSDLEAHLSDKHQVVRNHELVGQVSLDQLEASISRRRGDEEGEEPLSNLEQDNSDSEDKQTGGSDTDFTNIPAEPDTHQKQGEDRQREKPASVSDIQCEDATLNNTVQMKRDPQKQAGIVGLQNTTTGEQLGNEGESSASDCNDGKKAKQSNESHTDGEDTNFTQQTKEAGEGSSASRFKEDNAQVDKTHSAAPEQRTLDVNAREQGDILCDTPTPDEDSSASNMHREAEEQRAVKMELDTGSNREQSHHMSVDEDQINTHATTLNLAQKTVTHERNSVNVSPNSAHEESLAVAKCKEELVQDDEIMASYGEMPVLENEYLKEELVALGCCKEEEEEEEVYYSEQKQDREIEIKEEDEERQCSDEQHVSPDVCKAAEAAAEDLRSSHTQEKLYTCEFCGRNLTNSSDLKHHVMRHRI